MIYALLRGMLGLVALIGLLYLLSENRKKIAWRTIFPALGLQLFLAILVMKVAVVSRAFTLVSGFIVELLGFSRRGAEFWFGYRDWETDRKSTRLNSSHSRASRMPSSA